MVMIAAAAQGMPENTSNISHVTDLVQASQLIPIERLAMILGILAVAAVLVSMFELGRIGYGSHAGSNADNGRGQGGTAAWLQSRTFQEHW